MKNFKVNIWFANSSNGVLSSSMATGRGRSPGVDISETHTLKHTVEVETTDSITACSKALEKAIATYPPLPEIEPGQIRVTVRDENRRPDASDIFIVFDSQTESFEGEFLYTGDLNPQPFVKVQILDPSLTGVSVH